VIAAGDFVWTMFPFGPPDRPDEPGPTRHVAYVLATSSAAAVPMALLAYTSSGPWRGAAARLPAGVLEFDAAAARALGQKPFHLDLRCLAQVPLTARWFPDWAQPGHGVVGTAGARLRARIEARLSELVARNRDVIEVRGVR
jgi:hypothetical protein